MKIKVTTDNSVSDFTRSANAVRAVLGNQIVPKVAIRTGLPGPAGGGAASQQYNQTTALGTWTITHNMGRLPNVEVYTASGEAVIADVSSTTTTTTITFAVPATGYAILS